MRYRSYKENFENALVTVRAMALKEIKEDLLYRNTYHRWYVEALEQVLAERTGKF